MPVANTIELTPVEDDARWNPVVGKHTQDFLRMKAGNGSGLDTDAMSRVLTEASDILAHCASPQDVTGNSAVLVVGYVQSGKTLSFTTVAALARDNGYGIVLVIAGTTRNLKSQSEDRLETDLGLGQLQSAWTHESNPTVSEVPNLRRIVDNWKRHQAGQSLRDKPALLITVLKNATRIRAAAAALKALELSGVPTLIIDDESDQASLNTKTRSNRAKQEHNESDTYKAIVELRSVLPHHSYLHYTATPQANLLGEVSDILNPSYAKVIESGDAYTGGKYFFQDHRTEIVKVLPTKDVYDPKAPPTEAPESLQLALRYFLLGAAATAIEERVENRSMMVQASQSTAPHATYASWLEELLAAWSTLLRSHDSAVLEVIAEDMVEPYRDLATTYPALPSLDELLEILPEICEEVRVAQVNSVGEEKELKWPSAQFWILVGGQKLDRGFTVEGLIVTYMPRNISENADVLQQRARFFGYRRSYIGLCRVFMPLVSITAFAGYVNDEEELRDALLSHSGRPLDEWRREFQLSSGMKRLTRPGIVGRDLTRQKSRGDWAYPRALNSPPLAVAKNLEIADEFMSRMRNSSGLQNMASMAEIIDRRRDVDPNLIAQSVSGEIVASLLRSLQVHDPADARLTSRLIDIFGSTDFADVIFLSSLSRRGQRGRSLESLRRNLFIGRSPDGEQDRSALQYIGDRDLRVGDHLTLHLRRLLLVGESAPQEVLWFAAYAPELSQTDVLIEVP